MARVLLVEEDKVIRALFVLELSEQGHEVLAASSSRKLFKEAKNLRPDLLVLGSWQIVRDDKQTLDKIRGINEDLPVIMWTYDYSDAPEKRVAAAYHVLKSYDLTQLKSTIERALEAKGLLAVHRNRPKGGGKKTRLANTRFSWKRILKNIPSCSYS